MASLPTSPSLAKRRAGGPATNNDNDLTQSLKNLSLSASSPAGPPPRSFRSPIENPTSSSPRSNYARNSLNGISPTNAPPSRTGTPTLLRKASVNSLHSVSSAVPQRRASSVNMSSPSARKRSPLRSVSPDPQAPPRPVVTANSIANAHFKQELELRHAPESAPDADTLVLLNDSCYGHRYSRPRTSRAALSTIVERPERIKASALGVAAAYVRLGERHADGAFPPHPRRDPGSIPSIPFRIQKTSRRLPLLSQTVTNVHGAKWMEELKTMCDAAESKLAMNGKELQRPDMDRGPDDKNPRKLHEGDLYLCAESLDAMEGALGGVCDAVDAVFADHGPKRAFVAIRPPGHHCSASYPSGFCWINNVHVGIMHSILSHGLTHAAIVDFDLHHGDGSQSIAWQHNARGVGLGKNAAWWKKTSIGYFSLHDINSFPCEMGDDEKVKNASICIDNAHGQSVWNIHLQPWKNETEFWQHYESKYSFLLEKLRDFLKGQAERLRASSLKSKAAIFLSAGFDASEWEGAGMQRHNVNVPTEFYARFTRDIVRIAAEEGTTVEGRIISVLEGGYSDRALYSGVLSHVSGLAGDDPATKDQEYNGLGFEMGQRIHSSTGRRSVSGGRRSISGGRKDSSASERGTRPYDPSWWSRSELESLDTVMAPPPEPDIKKTRKVSAPTYYSATQSSSAKVVATPKLRRSVSGMSLNSGSPSIVRPPTPPPPEVPWTIATHELSKLLVPIDRQTGSCKHEDLAAEATRQRRDRQSALSQSLPPGSVPQPSAAAAPTRMGLRERKAKPTLPLTEEDDEKDFKGRRKTVGATVSTAEKGTPRGAAARRQPGRPGRRLSAASTVAVPDSADRMTPPSTSSSGLSRPATAHSVRPESSMSVRNSGPTSLAVKKTRTAAAPKKEAAPRASRVQKKADSSVAPSQGSSDSIDSLANDMKKIKITLVTKEQREAREKERMEKQKTDAQQFAGVPEQHPTIELGEAILESPAGTPTPGYGAFAGGPEHLRPDARPAVPGLAIAGSEPIEHNLASPASPEYVSHPASSPVRRGPASDTQPSTPDVFISYQPEGPTPEAIPQKEPLQWLPPNSSTPMAARTADLPVFTSTSTIPFAPRPGSAGSTGGSMVQTPTSVSPRKSGRPADQPIWEVPESP